MQIKHIHTSYGVRPGDHYKTFQWFHLACNVPTEVSPPVWALHPPKSPLLCLMGSAVATLPTPSHGSAIIVSPNIPAVCHHSFPTQPVGTPRLASTTYYSRSYPYMLSWLYYFHGWSLHESVLRFGCDNKSQASSITPDKALNRWHHTEQFQSCHPKSYSPH
jgi:hypothetical protein